MLARNVLWACRANSELANLDGKVSAEDRLRQTWDATVVSMRLIMLSSLFLGVSRRTQSLAELARGLDRLYGAPSSTQYGTLKEGVTSILGEKAFWPLFFRVVLGQPISQPSVEKMLKEAVRASRAAGYHSAFTNFAAVHSSGTSKVMTVTGAVAIA